MTRALTTCKAWTLLSERYFGIAQRQWLSGYLWLSLKTTRWETSTCPDFQGCSSTTSWLSLWAWSILKSCILISASTRSRLRCMLLNGYSHYLHLWFLLSKWDSFSLSSTNTNGSFSTRWYFLFWSTWSKIFFKKKNCGLLLRKFKVKLLKKAMEAVQKK